MTESNQTQHILANMNPLTHLVKFSSKQHKSYSVLVDIFQIYFRNIILFCTGLSMVRLLFGEIIVCQTMGRSVSQTFVDTKCYINGTITDKEGLYHDYYQWVSVYLLLCAFAFYFPYSIWAKLFANYIRHLESLSDKPEQAIQVIKDSKGNFIFFKTLTLEIFYTVYLFFILFLTDLFFNGIWSRFSWSYTAVYKIFPDTGKCNVTYFHAGGDTDDRFICLLPLCSVYRKVFSALYILTITLIISNVCIISYRIFLMWRKRKCVNIWWAFEIVKCCTVSWNVKRKLSFALNEMSREL